MSTPLRRNTTVDHCPHLFPMRIFCQYLASAVQHNTFTYPTRAATTVCVADALFLCVHVAVLLVWLYAPALSVLSIRHIGCIISVSRWFSVDFAWLKVGVVRLRVSDSHWGAEECSDVLVRGKLRVIYSFLWCNLKPVVLIENVVQTCFFVYLLSCHFCWETVV